MLIVYIFYKMSSIEIMMCFCNMISFISYVIIMSEQEKKKIWKAGRVFIWIFALFVLWIAINSWKNATIEQNQPTIQKSDPLQERIARINELYAEDEAFEKAEEIEKDIIWIFFVSDPTEDIETITRWQSMNLSNELNGVASVKTFVWWNAKMFCTATKWQVNDCIDYK